MRRPVRGLRIGLAALVLAVIALAGGSAVAVAAEVEPIRALTTADVRQGTMAAVERLAQGLEGTTQGRIRIQLEHGAADAAAVLDPVRRGEATLGLVRVAEIASLAPELALLSVPFLFRDPQKAASLVDAVWLGPLLNDQLRKEGLEPLGFLNAGALRLAGPGMPALGQGQPQQIVARPGELRALAFRALGLEPVTGGGAPGPAALRELRSDDLAAEVMAAGQGQQLQVVEAPHAYDLVVLLASRARFGELPLDVRETMRQRVQAVATWQQGAVAQAESLALTGLRQGGGRLLTLDPDQVRQAHERVLAAVRQTPPANADPSIVSTVLSYAD